MTELQARTVASISINRKAKKIGLNVKTHKKPRINATLQKLDNELMEECRKQVLLVYGCAGIALCRNHGWKKLRIDRLYELTDKIWHECGGNNRVSMLNMLEDETGIEMRLQENGRSFHEIDYLNGDMQRYTPEKMVPAQIIIMRRGQIKWVRAMVQACLYLALHRKEKFGFERIQKLVSEIYEIENEFENDTKAIAEECKKLFNINIVMKFTEAQE